VIEVRDGGPEDRAFIEDLGKRTLGDSVASWRPHDPAAAGDAYERLLDFTFEKRHRVFVGFTGGERAGFVVLLEDLPDEVTGSPQAFIAYMAVEPALRRRGVGAEMLRAAEDYARERGLPYLALMVTEQNAAARNLYDGRGYVTERRLLCKLL